MSKNPVVPAKVQLAWRLMQDDPKQTLQTAAAAVGLSAYKLREFLNRPHVRKWIMDEKRLQLEAINAGNPEALRRIRDAEEGNQMAQVASIKTLEALKELVDPSLGVRAPQHAPGLVVQIINSTGEVTKTIGGPPPTPLQIEGEAEREGLERSYHGN